MSSHRQDVLVSLPLRPIWQAVEPHIRMGGNPETDIEAVKHNEKLSDAEKEAKIAALKAEWQERHNAVLAAGGLHIAGTERHESRRIDNQLRGRWLSG